MKITPLDITQKRFPAALRGYDRQEVEAFLSLVASEFEELVREVQALRSDVSRMDEEIAEHRSRERALQETMVTAQKACEDIRESARKEAEITLAEAELQGERIVQGAHTKFLRIVDDIAELKRQRAAFEAQVRAVVESHGKLLDVFQEADGEEQVQYLPAKKK
ncbi:MAG: DivIVA domain-containing protein [Deltaproteobacteria bacterium]|nr:DivIVA domain-containing protein [Deltaproteobacteria bacterium]